MYTVTQSLSNSLLGDVVLDNMVYRDEDSILDQTYQKKICSDFYHDDFLIFIKLYANEY